MQLLHLFITDIAESTPAASNHPTVLITAGIMHPAYTDASLFSKSARELVQSRESFIVGLHHALMKTSSEKPRDRYMYKNKV